LSDGIFAVAMTLLVLDLKAPAAEAVHNEPELWRALAALGPQIVMYMMSFLTLGIFWVGQQTQLNHVVRSHRTLSWTHLVFLFAVTMLPFSTRLLAEFAVYRTALLLYWANLVLLGAALYVSWMCATRSHVVRDDMPPEVSAAICRRILIAQALYGFGALLCVFNTYWSIAFIVIVQLNYAFGLHIRRTRGDEPR
jgi:uncharacterized membrane protein